MDEREYRLRLAAASIDASAAGDQAEARRLSAELVAIATRRAEPKIRRRAAWTIEDLLKP